MFNRKQAVNPVEATETVNAALIVFGKDESDKPHASQFAAHDCEAAIKAAGLMGFQALVVTDDPMKEIAAKLPAGRIFESGKAFVPFVKAEVFETLAAHAEAHPDQVQLRPVRAAPEGEGDDPVAGAAESTATDEDDLSIADDDAGGLAVTFPADWADIHVGARVLATEGPDDGWWEAIVRRVHDSGLSDHVVRMLTLEWEGCPDESSFVRRADHVALMPPAYSAARYDAGQNGEEG
ncbi:hypothetical protein GGD81_004096 [Rhodobium orientis]|uniref:Uncharacterized protein n=1 Tax=Rhodobium orientis TaxID=34017 RepID=A0A327JNK6_9HYPH|nr:hypothetical protein [Rhodobium orientis]MBB4305030.1 hypothetical protein [Rhodobium orientis]MBK5948764.1 hypothetical protein [Rhodobium orientis]RAI26472.1 hypothetical protein CH339_14175 [Rhodobium orientis]